MRCFIAVGAPREVRDALVPVQRGIAAFGGMKAVEYENLHLSLRFLGEVPDSGLERLKQALGIVKAAPFKAVVKGLGAFPDTSNPRVVWAGLDEGYDEMVRLNDIVDACLRPLGFDEQERFHPHITLGRVKGPTDRARLKAMIGEYDKTVFGAFEVRGFCLMMSELASGGPRYSEVAAYRLV